MEVMEVSMDSKSEEGKHPFNYVLNVMPLGMMYGSSGAFLSPENLVGRSGDKFPPDAATIAGLIVSQISGGETVRKSIARNLKVAGPFIGTANSSGRVGDIYVPIPRTYSIANNPKNSTSRIVAQWSLSSYPNQAGLDYHEKLAWKCDHEDITADYTWQKIDKFEDFINGNLKKIKKSSIEAKNMSDFRSYNPILHPWLKANQRCVKGEGGLFLENSVQMADNVFLVYLSSHALEKNVDWYRFGGEGHLAEISCDELAKRFDTFNKLLNQPIQRAFALITPAVWGSNRLSERYPTNWDFKVEALLTDKPVPFRHRLGGQLRRGRYAVPAGSVYVLDRPIDKPWYQWDEDWFPREGLSLKRFGTGLCLPIQIPGLDDD
jgi:CRISPR-associated protein Cmr3